jgi:hypothetical protein
MDVEVSDSGGVDHGRVAGMWKMSTSSLVALLGFVAGCADPPPGTGGDGNDVSDVDDLPPDDIDAGPLSCGEWRTGTLTGYNNSDFGDDPHAGSVMEFTGLNDSFYDNVNMAAVDFGDWDGDQYRWI